MDLAFFGANLSKVLTGGYVPVFLACVLITVMWTWVKGTGILFEKTRRTDVPLQELIGMLQKSPPHRVKGTAVFLTSDPDTSPAALLHNLKHNKVLHEKNVILTVRTRDIPRVEDEDRVGVGVAGDHHAGGVPAVADELRTGRGSRAAYSQERHAHGFSPDQ